MKHPYSRSERRFAKEIWRNRRRKLLVIWGTYPYPKYDLASAMDNTWWDRCDRKQGCHCHICSYDRAQQKRDNRSRRQELKKMGETDTV